MGTLSEAEVVAQLDAQHTQYMANPALVGSDLQTEHDARVTRANAAHTQVTSTSAGFKAGLNVEDASSANGRITADRYTGGNVVAPVNATYMEAQVRAALDADELFTHGGPYTSDYSLASPYADGLTLIEAQKLTGENFF